LLLIVGDGIKEGAQGITEFLSNSAHLNFTLAMVELSVYESAEIGRIIIPKTIVKTKEISKFTIEIPYGHSLTINDQVETEYRNATKTVSPEKEKERKFYINYWHEFIKQLNLDDPGQALPSPATSTNLYLYPGPNKKAWISAYFSKSTNRVGVYFKTANDQEGQEILRILSDQKEQIKLELGSEVWGLEDNVHVGVRFQCNNVFSDESKTEITEFFNKWLNTFVNVFRPRLKVLSVEK
jgi:hypothetical protein